jgi:hypothetical protein
MFITGLVISLSKERNEATQRGFLDLVPSAFPGAS